MPEMNAMVLAAGLGLRMRPITETLPKPLVRVAGKPLIDYALDALADAGAARAVVNVHHLAGQICAHLAAYSRLETVVSDESDRLLDSGGGIVRALPLLGEAPFFILNADTFWIDDPAAGCSNLQALAESFDPARMDILVMVARFDQAIGHTGRGDFVLGASGRLIRFDGANGSPVIYAGALVCHPRVFADAPKGPFSLNHTFDAAIAAGRFYGMPMRGRWITVGTPEAIPAAEAALIASAGAEAG